MSAARPPINNDGVDDGRGVGEGEDDGRGGGDVDDGRHNAQR